MTEKDLQVALFRRYSKGWKVACPNKHMFGWEADVLSVTPKHYTTEYEIKLTKADFLKDAEKGWADYGKNYVSKYDRMISGQGPNRFFYVIMKDVVDVDMIPDFAGYIEATKTKRGGFFLHQKKPAKRLHNKKLTDKKIQVIYRSLYYRTWNNML